MKEGYKVQKEEGEQINARFGSRFWGVKVEKLKLLITMRENRLAVNWVAGERPAFCASEPSLEGYDGLAGTPLVMMISCVDE